MARAAIGLEASLLKPASILPIGERNRAKRLHRMAWIVGPSAGARCTSSYHNGDAASEGNRVKFSAGVAGPDDIDELRDLYEWVNSEPQLRNGVEMTFAGGAPSPDEMGTTLDVIEFVVNSSISLGSLIVAIAAWRDSRHRRPAVEFRRDHQLTVTMTSSDDAAVKEITLRLSDSADSPEA